MTVVSPNPVAAEFYGATYKVQTAPLFNGAPTQAQVNQGYVGDCYLLVAMISVANLNPSFIQKMIKDNGNGTFTVNFYNGPNAGLGGSEPNFLITVDNQLPVMKAPYHYRDGSTLLGVNGGAGTGAPIWAGIIEKAYVVLQSLVNGAPNDYASIWDDGVDSGITAITGQEVYDYLYDVNTTPPSLINPDGTVTPSSPAEEASLLITIQQALAAGNAVTMDDSSIIPGKAPNLVGAHAYAITAVDLVKKTVTFDNPWNASYSGGGLHTDTIASLANAGVAFHIAQGAVRTLA